VRRRQVRELLTGRYDPVAPDRVVRDDTDANFDAARDCVPMPMHGKFGLSVPTLFWYFRNILWQSV
jgi:hypothetical protein